MCAYAEKSRSSGVAGSFFKWVHQLGRCPAADSGLSDGGSVTSQRLGSATPPDINYLFNHLSHRTEVCVN